MRDLKKEMLAFEDILVREALAKHPLNHAAAARYLGIKRTSLLQKMRRLGIPLSDRRRPIADQKV